MSADLSRVNSFQYPAAHLGHLNPAQQTALDTFRNLAAKRGYFFPAGKDGRKVASHDDETLLRYLRARKFVPEDAFKQFKDTEDWRKENSIQEVYTTIDIGEYDDSRRLYPQWTGRRDKRGIPVYVFEIAPLNTKTINEYQNKLANSPASKLKTKTAPRMLRLFALYENLTHFVLPLCSAIQDRPYPETPVSQSNNIVDISNVGLKQFWNLKGHMQDASQLATAYYPETLDRIFIIGAPSFFPTVWGWIKRWFDPITVSKIFILSPADAKATLEKYIDIENIPKKYGGQLPFEWGMMPILDPAIEKAIKWEDPTALQNGSRTLPAGPLKWRSTSDGTMQCIAVGSENGSPREKIVGSIKTQFSAFPGISRANTTDNLNAGLVPSTSGLHTQPKEDGDLYYGSELQTQGETSSERTGTSIPDPASVGAAPAPTQSGNSTADTPARPLNGAKDLPPSESQPRTGTSETKSEQQTATHAEGNLDEGTPHTINYGAGDKAQIVEPATIGQAPKDVTANLPQPEESPAPGVLAKAQNAASSVVGAAGAAVGSITGAIGSLALGTGKTEEKKQPDKPKDERVDQAEDTKVEAFIKAQHSNGTLSAA